MSEPATREDLQRTADDIRAEMKRTADEIRAEIERTAENILQLIASLSGRIDQRFEAVEKRFDSADRRFGVLESRVDRLADTVGSIFHQLGGFTRWAEQVDRHQTQIIAIQAAQQHFMDKLAERTLKLEQQRPPQ